MKQFKCSNNFKVRIPYLPFEKYLENFNNDIEGFTNNYFKENLLISSYSLYKELAKQNKSSNMEKGMLKYLIRASTRTTPYGLNSAIIDGDFSKVNSFIVNKDSLKKRVRPDMEWLVKIIKSMEDQYFYSLSVIKNTALDINEYKITKLWNSAYLQNEMELNNVISINNTNLVKFIFQNSSSYIKTKELIELIKNEYPLVHEEKIVKVLQDLVQNEFLITNIRFPLQNSEPFRELLEFVKSNHLTGELVIKLLDLEKLIISYEKKKIGEGINEYIEILNKMKEIEKADNYVQVDMYSNSNISISNYLKKQIEDIFEKFNSLTLKYDYKEYISKFREKYGNVAVKYLDVIDLEKGIGMPKRDETDIYEYKITLFKEISKYINSKEECYLDLADIPNIYEDEFNFGSKELSFYIFRSDDTLKLCCSPIIGSNHKECLTGRFQYLFSDKATNPEIDLVNLSFIPKTSRHLNVAMYNSESNNYLEYGTKSFNKNINSIDINDIYMFIDDNKIKFLNIKDNRELEFNLPNMLNETLYPKELRVLRDICIYQNGSVYDFFTNLIDILYKKEGKYFPIVYKNLTLVPKSWKIIYPEGKRYKNFEMFNNYLEEYKIKYALDDIVLAGSGDRRLLLNLKIEPHKKILYELLQKEKNMLLYEDIFSKNSLIINDEFGCHYVGEFVFKLEGENKRYTKKNIPLVNFEDMMKLSTLTSKNWISMKIYINENYNEVVISRYINYLIKNFYINKKIELIYYVRYKDPKSHIRLRIKFKNDERNEILETIDTFIENLQNVNIINDYVIDTYYQEYERYGGINCIERAEKVFTLDSYICSEIIKMKSIIFNEYTYLQIYILSVIKLFDDINLPLELQLRILKSYKNIKIDSKEYSNDINNIKDIISY